VLGAAVGLTPDQVCARAGVDRATASRYWRALGFPDVDDQPVLTGADADALAVMAALVASGRLSDDAALGLVRALGATSSRLAAWEVDLVVSELARVDLPRADVPGGEAAAATAALVPELAELLDYAWRRHLQAALGRLAADEGPTEVVATVGFADLVGFTRLTRRLSEAELADLVQRFEEAGADVLTAAGARRLKTLGDEVLFTADDPPAAAAGALDLLDRFADDDVVPELRVGLATGTVVTRMGDLFGTTVNLASRLTALARPGTALCDAETAAALAGDPRFATVALWRRPVRGLGLVEPFALQRATGPEPWLGASGAGA